MQEYKSTPTPLFAVVHGSVKRGDFAAMTAELLERYGLGAFVAASREEALERAADPSCALAVELTGEPGFLADALAGKATPVLVAAGDAPNGDEAVALLDPADLVVRLRAIVRHAKRASRALARMRALARVDGDGTAPGVAAALPAELPPGAEIFAHEIIALARDSRPVVVQGPPGMGKRQIARLVHAASVRRAGPLVVLEGAGATADALAGAHGGTLVIDGADMMDGPFAAALATLVRERRVEDRVVDARIVLLVRDDRAAKLRSVAPRAVLKRAHVLRLGSLGDRPLEVLSLADSFLEAEGEPGAESIKLSLPALECILAYAWPEGIAELKSACVEALKAAEGQPAIEPEHLPAAVRGALSGAEARPTLSSVVEAVERALLRRSIYQHRGSVTRVSRSLGMAPRTIRRKILHYGLSEETNNLRRSA